MKNRAVSRAKKHTLATRFFVRTRFSHRMTTETALHMKVVTRTGAYKQATKIMSPAIASTNMRSVSKATRAGTCRQQNIACALCAHAVVVEKRDDHRADIVASPVGHARKHLRIQSGAVSTGVERTHPVSAALDLWYAA